jgi:zinc protease
MLFARSFVAAATVACTMAVGVGPALGQAATSAGRLPEITTFSLDNGLEVAHARIGRVPLVSVQLWYRAGSRDEKPDRRGTARMLQALMFEGSERVRPGDHARFVHDLGGFARALTSEDATFYENTLPREYLDFAMALEAERMQHLTIRDGALETVRRGLAAELRQQEQGPLARGFASFLEAAFTQHPYRWTAAGASADIANIRVADVEEFYRHNYVPNNALLVVVGDVTADEARAAAQKHFGPLARRPDPPRPSVALAEPPQTEARRVVTTPSSNLGFVVAGYRIPPAKHPDVNVLQMLTVILTSGEESRLGRRLVAAGARQTGGQAIVREEPGLLVALAAYDDAARAEEVEKALLSEIERLKSAPPSAAELEQARTGVLANLLFNMESVSGFAGHVGQSWVLTGEAAHFTRDIEEFEKMKPADLQRVAREHLRDEHRTVLVVPIGGAR